MQFKRFFKKRLPPKEKEILKAISLYFQGKVVHINSDLSPKSDFKLPNKILVGTHHKSGTVWLESVFRSVCEYYDLIFCKSNQVSNSNPPSKFDIFQQHHSQFDLEAIQSPYRGVHIIRDPRDLIVSGCFYHQKSSEKWLHRPNDQWQGLTYQEKINSYNNFDDKLLFEMENSAQRNINRILSWNYHNPQFYEIKYERLIKDFDLLLFHEIFSFLGFPGSAIPNVLMIAYKNSLFSGDITSTHIRSGKTSQWKQYFKPIHKKRFIELFDDCLVKLDYEVNNEWALQPTMQEDHPEH